MATPASATRAAKVAPWRTVQTDLQYIIRPGGVALNDDGQLPGERVGARTAQHCEFSGFERRPYRSARSIKRRPSDVTELRPLTAAT
jgi:hypothetical protein